MAAGRSNMMPARVWESRVMIDTLSLLLSHFLMMLIMFCVAKQPDPKIEPDPEGRHFKSIGPKAEGYDGRERFRSNRPRA